MNPYPNTRFTNPTQGQVLRLCERYEIAIYARGGVSWAAEFRDGCGELTDAATWFRFRAGALRYSHSRRAAALASATALAPEIIEKIDRLHHNLDAYEDAGMSAALLESLKHHWADLAHRIRRLVASRQNIWR